MDLPELGAYIDTHFRTAGDSLFRIEALPEYTVDSDGEDYRRWRDGEPEPTWSRKQPWLDTISRWRDTGMRYHRVRIFSEQLTDYERYACEFGYTYNATAGEDIRVLRRGEHAIPTRLIEHDFWVINDALAVTMHYGGDGRFEAAEVVEPIDSGDYLTTRSAAWDAAEPFTTWWTRHPELHRKIAA